MWGRGNGRSSRRRRRNGRGETRQRTLDRSGRRGGQGRREAARWTGDDGRSWRRVGVWRGGTRRRGIWRAGRHGAVRRDCEQPCLCQPRLPDTVQARVKGKAKCSPLPAPKRFCSPPAGRACPAVNPIGDPAPPALPGGELALPGAGGPGGDAAPPADDGANEWMPGSWRTGIEFGKSDFSAAASEADGRTALRSERVSVCRARGRGRGEGRRRRTRADWLDVRLLVCVCCVYSRTCQSSPSVAIAENAAVEGERTGRGRRRAR